MKKVLLLASAITLSGSVHAQTFNNVFFDLDFDASGATLSDYVTGNVNTPNNKTHLGVFNPLVNAVTEPATIALVQEGSNKVLKITRPATLTDGQDNTWAMLRKFDFKDDEAPKVVMLKYRLKIVNTSEAGTKGTASANMFNIFSAQLGDNGSVITENNPGVQPNTVYANANYTVNETSFITTNPQNTTPTVANPDKFRTDYTEYTIVINNSASAITYTSPKGTSETVAAGKYDLFYNGVGAPASETIHFQDDLDLNAVNGSDFGSLKFGSQGKSWNSGNVKARSCEVYLDNIQLATNNTLVTLPVTLSSFTAKALNKAVQVQWSTLSENNSRKFELQRAYDGKNFSSIFTIAAAGNSNSLREYSFIDENPGAGTNYYRLKQYDLDGKVSTTQTIAVNSKLEETTITAYAGTNSVQLGVSSANKTSVAIAIYSVDGKKIAEQTASVEKGYNKIVINKTLTTGIYFVNFRSNGKTITVKFAAN